MEGVWRMTIKPYAATVSCKQCNTFKSSTWTKDEGNLVHLVLFPSHLALTWIEAPIQSECGHSLNMSPNYMSSMTMLFKKKRDDSI
jgi:hypothetical protein